jgi:glycosyltransferase involved in cell wall biosynthesis
MGKPVICSRVKAQIDVVRDGFTGLYVSPDDPKALRDAIVYLWNHPDKAAEMGREARAYVEVNHRLEEFFDQIKQAVREAIASREHPIHPGRKIVT